MEKLLEVLKEVDNVIFVDDYDNYAEFWLDGETLCCEEGLYSSYGKLRDVDDPLGELEFLCLSEGWDVYVKKGGVLSPFTM